MDETDLVIPIDDETELRLPIEEDAQEVWDAIVANMDRFEAYMDWLSQVKSLEDELAFIRTRRVELAEGRAVQFFVWHRGVFAGSIGTVFVDRNNDRAEIGYFVVREAEGTGLAYRSVSALIDHLFEVEGMHRVSVRIMPENQRSIALARRLGFGFEGIQRESYKVRGEHRDLEVHSILASEWRAREG